MELINLTPHPLKIHTTDGIKTIEPSGSIARVTSQEENAGDIDGIPVLRRKTGEPTGIPAPQKDTIYIVSSLVLAATDRPDVVAPDTGSGAVRDDQGRIQGVRGFVKNSSIKNETKLLCNLLDKVASELELKGLVKEAEAIDEVSNTLEAGMVSKAMIPVLFALNLFASQNPAAPNMTPDQLQKWLEKNKAQIEEAARKINSPEQIKEIYEYESASPIHVEKTKTSPGGRYTTNS